MTLKIGIWSPHFGCFEAEKAVEKKEISRKLSSGNELDGASFIILSFPISSYLEQFKPARLR